MRTLGLLSPLSGTTHDFFLRALDGELVRRGGEAHRAKVITLGFNPSTQLLEDEKWWTLVQHIRTHVGALADGGAEAVILAPIAWYRFAEEIGSDLPIPLLHPAPALAHGLARRPARSGPLGLLAPLWVTHPGPLQERLRRETQREVLVPSEDDAHALAGVTMPETDAGPPLTRDYVERIVNALRHAGAAAIIVATPELASLVDASDLATDCYDLPALQVSWAAEWMLANSSGARS